MFKKWLRALGKLDYVQGKNRPDVDCVLCAVRDDNEAVKSLKYYQDDLIFISLNLYPYNPAHSMVVPNAHRTELIDMTKAESLRILRAIQGVQMMLNDLYSPKGYNIGINQGRNAGGSIRHLHFHVVPRYGAELGYIDIVGKSRIVVEGLDSVLKKMKENIDDYLNPEFFNNFE
ncbi:MAG: HIT domain-containing protein [Promethearchaeia archaeon]